MTQNLWLLVQRFAWALMQAFRSEFRRVEAPLQGPSRYEPGLADIRAARRTWLNADPEYAGMAPGSNGVHKPVFECNMVPCSREGRLTKTWEE